MAKILANLTNVDAPVAPFTKGKIRDDDGSRNGTPVNTDLLSDATQFFAKLMDEAGITPNDNLDDQITNQLFQAFEAIEKPYVGEAKNPDFEGVSPGYAVFNITKQAVNIDLGASISDEIISLTSNVPIGKPITFWIEPGSGAFNLIINSTNLSFPATKQFRQAGVNANNQTLTIDFVNGDTFTVTEFDDFFLVNKP